jgi:hypothetical protein
MSDQLWTIVVFWATAGAAITSLIGVSVFVFVFWANRKLD